MVTKAIACAAWIPIIRASHINNSSKRVLHCNLRRLKVLYRQRIFNQSRVGMLRLPVLAQRDWSLSADGIPM